MNSILCFVKTYYTQFDNIGTDDKVFLTDENVGILDDIRSLYDGLVTDYLNNYYLPYKDRYNTLLYITPSNLFQSDFDYIFNLFGTKIEVVNLTKEEDFQQELTQNFISIIHHFQ